MRGDFMLEIIDKGILSAYNDIVDRIIYNSPSADVPINEMEKEFLLTLILSMINNNLADEEVTLRRMGDKTFNVDTTTCYVGKIRLQNDGCYIQVLRGLYNIKNMHGITFHQCLEQIPTWIRYIKYCRRI